MLSTANVALVKVAAPDFRDDEDARNLSRRTDVRLH